MEREEALTTSLLQGKQRKRISRSLIALSVLIVVLAIYVALISFIETAWLIDTLRNDGFATTKQPTSMILRDLFKANPSLFWEHNR